MLKFLYVVSLVLVKLNVTRGSMQKLDTYCVVVVALKMAHFYDMVDIIQHWLNHIPEEMALRALVHRSFGMY